MMMALNNEKNSSKGLKILSLFFILLAILYLLMPIDYDGPIIGLLDDFFIFMAAFCFCISQFTNSREIKAKRMLKRLSLFFFVIAILWLVILAFTPIAYWVA